MDGRTEGQSGRFLEMKGYTIFIAVIALCFRASVCAGYESDLQGGTFTFYQENDFYTGTDRDYTNGIKISWISPDLNNFRDDPHLPSWSHAMIDSMPFEAGDHFLKTVSLSVGQNIYTPENIRRLDYNPDDRPYAGISYISVGFHSRNARIMNTWEYTLGIIGPHSYAEEMQKAIHTWTKSDFPNGWGHQLKDEPILNVYYDRKWRFAGKGVTSGLGYDLIPHAGIFVGNALTAVNIGGQIRLGWNLPNDFGTLPIRPGSDTNAPLDGQDPRYRYRPHGFSTHAFVSTDVYAKLWDITLDGNFFRSSGHVDKEALVAEWAVGLGMITGRFKITYAYVSGTREYDTQRERQAYGAITVSYTFL
ncbi:MAG: lipid A deacylase LpxR family protein [Deltaproteobacteria bacterium]|nr:lipid A deacylase LpxR family protein [Deltaproteobacteria bacterium]